MENLNTKTEELIESFIKKWSCWFVFESNKEQLKEAMRNEILEILESNE